jgi:hypothetical protein
MIEVVGAGADVADEADAEESSAAGVEVAREAVAQLPLVPSRHRRLRGGLRDGGLRQGLLRSGASGKGYWVTENELTVLASSPVRGMLSLR